MAKKKKKNKEIEQAETRGRIEEFNRKLSKLAKEYEVKLDVQQRVVIVDNKPEK